MLTNSPNSNEEKSLFEKLGLPKYEPPSLSAMIPKDRGKITAALAAIGTTAVLAL